MQAVHPLTYANAIVDRALTSGEFITPMKLQKLLYFAHGFHLALYGEPVIREGFEAWPYGPVNRVTYETYAVYGNRAIDSPIWREGIRIIPRLAELHGVESATSMLDMIWNGYAGADAIELSQLTHLRNSPWRRIADSNDGNLKASKHIPIPDDQLERYFRCVIDKKGYEGTLDVEW